MLGSLLNRYFLVIVLGMSGGKSSSRGVMGVNNASVGSECPSFILLINDDILIVADLFLIILLFVEVLLGV